MKSFLMVTLMLAMGAGPATTQSARHRTIYLLDAGERMTEKAGAIRGRVGEAIGAMSVEDNFGIVIASNQAIVFRPVLLDATESAKDLAGIFLREKYKPAGEKWEITHQLELALGKSPTEVELISDGDLPDPTGMVNLAKKAKLLGIPINTTLRYKSGKYDAPRLLRRIAEESGGVCREE